MRSLALSLIALVACGKPAPGTDARQPATSPPPAAPPAAASGSVDIPAFCRATMAGKNPDQCYGKDARSEGIKTSFCVDVLATPLGAGKIKIDPAKLAACEQVAVANLESLSNQRSVTDLAERFPECRGVTTGTLPAGAECIGAMECAPGLICNAMKCEPPGQLGQACRQVIELTMAVVDSSCAPELHCSYRDHTCVARLAAGAACRLTQECQAGLKCRAGTCASAGNSKHGEECDESEECPRGDFCNLEHRCETLRADGEKCLTDSQCKGQCLEDGDSVSGHCGPC